MKQLTSTQSSSDKYVHRDYGYLHCVTSTSVRSNILHFLYFDLSDFTKCLFPEKVSFEFFFKRPLKDLTITHCRFMQTRVVSDHLVCDAVADISQLSKYGKIFPIIQQIGSLYQVINTSNH